MLLELRHLSKNYPSPAGQESVKVLEDINLQLNHGDSVAIVGPSGCGKSTLLNMMGTLDRPGSGHILLDEHDYSRLNDIELAAFRNRHIGFVFQQHHLLPQCSALENVLIPTLVASGPTSRREFETRAKQLLKEVGLESRMLHQPGELSMGECQRVAVVRALINHPRLLLADEPTGSLDHASGEKLIQLLLHFNRQKGVALILVTHSQDFAMRMASVFELQEGQLIPKKIPIQSG